MDRKPVIVYGSPGSDSDVQLWVLDDAIEGPIDKTDRLDLVLVENPFGRALSSGIDLNEEFEKDPLSAGDKLDRLVKEEITHIDLCLRNGIDGVFYELYGAHPKHCTPMQYGGLYLDRDREILESASGAVLNLLFVVGSEDTYFDFVSDLPAHVFAWDAPASGLTSQAMRGLRSGVQASADPASEILLAHGGTCLADLLEKKTVESV